MGLDKVEVRGYDFDEKALSIALSEFQDFKNSEKYDESYKWEIIRELNDWLSENEVNEETVVEFIEELKKKNQKHAPLTHWIEIDNLVNFSKENPEIASNIINQLFDENKDLEERINYFRNHLESGTSLFGFILSVYNSEKYGPYKNNTFQDFLKNFVNRDYPSLGDFSIAEKYKFFVDVCEEISDFISRKTGKDVGALDAQNFIYSVTEYDVKYDIELECLREFSRELEKYQEDPNVLLKIIKNLPRDHLKERQEYYEDRERVSKIRHEVLTRILNGEEVELENIKESVSSEYEKDILHSWDDFKILAQIYIDYSKNRINKYLDDISEFIINELQEEDLKYHTVNFEGASGFPGTMSWLAIYPKEKEGHQNSQQLFLAIHPEYVRYGLCPGGRFEGGRKDLEKDYDEKVSLNDVLERFRQDREEFYEINSGADVEKMSSEADRNYWKIWAGSRGKYFDDWLEGDFIAIGWDKIDPKGDIIKQARKVREGEDYDHIKRMFDYIMEEMEEGDIVFVPRKDGNVAVAEIVSDYYYNEAADTYSNRRDVRWILKEGFDPEKYGERLKRKLRSRRTITPIDDDESVEIIEDEILPEVGEDTSLEEKELPAEEMLNEVFRNSEDIEEARNYFMKLFDFLGDPDDLKSQMSVTYNGNRKMVSVNFGRWKLFSIEKTAVGYLAQFAADMSILTEGYKKWEEFVEEYEGFARGEDYNLVRLEWNKGILERHPELEEAWAEAVEFARREFKSWESSPYGKFHQEELYNWIMGREVESDVGKMNYFWITANPKIWEVSEIKDGGEVFYTAYNKKGNKRRVYGNFEKASPGDKVIFYESTPVKKIVAEGEITQGLHKEDEAGYDQPEGVEGISIRFERYMDEISWDQLADIPELEDSEPIRNQAQGSLFKLTKNEYETILALEPEGPEAGKDMIEKLEEINEADLEVGDLNITEGLFFPEEMERNIEESVISALKSGKNIIFTGPPGTGKTKLAKNVAKKVADGCDCVDDPVFTTATADWTTFDTIGGYHPEKKGDGLSFKPGQFLKCFKKKGKPVNKWLIIDEINRADIDKAFGQLFSVLSGDSVELPFSDEKDRKIRIKNLEEDNLEEIGYSDNNYYVTENWRLLATMNTYDKSSLYEMSYAFMRRFAFIDVSIPKEDIDEGLISRYIEEWDSVDEDEVDDLFGDIIKIWTTLNEEKRSIGPAIIRDMLLFLQEYEGESPMSNALKLYVLPQLEGMIKQNQTEIFASLIDRGIGTEEELKRIAKERFEISESKIDDAVGKGE